MKYLSMVLILSFLALAGQVSAQNVLVNSFETPADFEMMTCSGYGTANLNMTPRHVTEGKQALQANFYSGSYPFVKMTPLTPWNWSAQGGLAIDITNPNSTPIAFGIAIYDSTTIGISHSQGSCAIAQPHQTVTFVLPFSAPPAPLNYGMRRLLPTFPGMTALEYYPNASFNFGHIVSFKIFVHAPSSKQVLCLDNVRVLAAVNVMAQLSGAVDAYGQNAHQEWPGKLHDPAEFAMRRATEEAALAASPGLPDRDSYGGWSAGPPQTATGWFYSKQVSGKWWLVDPIGNLFFSVGMDAVATNGATMVTGREYMFSALPGNADLLAKYYKSTSSVFKGPVASGITYNFYAANLARKYGDNSVALWQQAALERMKSWGFNTLGGGTDWNLYQTKQMPYTVIWETPTDHALVSTDANLWGPMPDPFDPLFASETISRFLYLGPNFRHDPNCIGYYVDNELCWSGHGANARYALAYGALILSSAVSPAKAAFVTQLQSKYGVIGAFNTAWGTSLASWAALGTPFTAPATASAAQTTDMSAFLLSFARKYFSVVRAAVKAADPHHLYLGCRFGAQRWPPEAVQASAESCDVVSFNLYLPTLATDELAFINGLNKPCIVSEFHFGATDRGMFSGGIVDAGTQSDRGAAYQAYVQSAAASPMFVGCQYLQDVDQPLTGTSYDGENYGVGFVDVTDTPYPEIVSAAKAAHEAIYSEHYGL